MLFVLLFVLLHVLCHGYVEPSGQVTLNWFRNPYSRPPCPVPIALGDDTPFIPVNLLHAPPIGLIALGFAPHCARSALLPQPDQIPACLASLTGTVALSTNLGVSYSCKGVFSEVARLQAASFSFTNASNETLSCVLGGYVADSGMRPVMTASVSCTQTLDDWFEATALPVPMASMTAAVRNNEVYLAGGERGDPALTNVLFRIYIVSKFDGPDLDEDWQIVAYTSPVANRLFPFLLPVQGGPGLLAANGRNLSGSWLLLGAGMRNVSSIGPGNTSIVSLGSAVDGLVQAYDTWTIRPSILSPLTDPRIIQIQQPELWAAYSLLSTAVPSVDRTALTVLMKSPAPPRSSTTPILLFSGSGAFYSRNLGGTWSMVQHKLVGSPITSTIVPGSRAQLWVHDHHGETAIVVISDREKSIYRGYFRSCNDSCPQQQYFTGCSSSPYEGSCAPCTVCTPGQSYAVKACGVMHPMGWSDTLCAPCRICPNGRVLHVCNATSDTVCSEQAPVGEEIVFQQERDIIWYRQLSYGALGMFGVLWAVGTTFSVMYQAAPSLAASSKTHLATLAARFADINSGKHVGLPVVPPVPVMQALGAISAWLTFFLGSMLTDTALQQLPATQATQAWAYAIIAANCGFCLLLPLLMQIVIMCRQGVHVPVWKAASNLLVTIIAPNSLLLQFQQRASAHERGKIAVLLVLCWLEAIVVVVNQLVLLLVVGYSAVGEITLASSSGNAIAWLTAVAAAVHLGFSMHALLKFRWKPNSKAKPALDGANSGLQFHEINPMLLRTGSFPRTEVTRSQIVSVRAPAQSVARSSIASSCDSAETGESKDDAWSVDLHADEAAAEPVIRVNSNNSSMPSSPNISNTNDSTAAIGAPRDVVVNPMTIAVPGRFERKEHRTTPPSSADSLHRGMPVMRQVLPVDRSPTADAPTISSSSRPLVQRQTSANNTAPTQAPASVDVQPQPHVAALRSALAAPHHFMQSAVASEPMHVRLPSQPMQHHAVMSPMMPANQIFMPHAHPAFYDPRRFVAAPSYMLQNSGAAVSQRPVVLASPFLMGRGATPRTPASNNRAYNDEDDDGDDDDDDDYDDDDEEEDGGWMPPDREDDDEGDEHGGRDDDPN